MKPSLIPAGRAKLDEAIKVWRERHPPPDKYAERVLERLYDNSRTAEAFAKIDPEPKAAYRIVNACVEAEINARTFKGLLRREQRTLKILQTAHDGLEACGLLFAELDRPGDPLAAAYLVDMPAKLVPLNAKVSRSNPSRREILREGLAEWRGLVEARRSIARDTAARIGATRNVGAVSRKGEKTTRKNREKKAAVRAAIFWLAAGVRGATGKTHMDAVATLAEITLAKSASTITVDQVKAAYRGRTKRDWRQS